MEKVVRQRGVWGWTEGVEQGKEKEREREKSKQAGIHMHVHKCIDT